MASQQLLVTSVGEDRPGILARLTEVFVSHGANLEESRMAILGGEFAAIMLISIPDENLAALNKDLDKLQAEGLTVTSKKTQSIKADRFKDHLGCKVILKGADHEGIVYRVSAYLRDKAVNIQSAETELVHAPQTGSPLFHLRAIVFVPPAIALVELRKGLDLIAQEECVDIELAETALPVGAN